MDFILPPNFLLFASPAMLCFVVVNYLRVIRVHEKNTKGRELFLLLSVALHTASEIRPRACSMIANKVTLTPSNKESIASDAI